MKLTIAIIVYFSLPLVTVLAHEGEENITIISDADWIGPLTAVLIIIIVLIIAKIIKKSR